MGACPRGGLVLGPGVCCWSLAPCRPPPLLGTGRCLVVWGFAVVSKELREAPGKQRSSCNKRSAASSRTAVSPRLAQRWSLRRRSCFKYDHFLRAVIPERQPDLFANAYKILSRRKHSKQEAALLPPVRLSPLERGVGGCSAQGVLGLLVACSAPCRLTGTSPGLGGFCIGTKPERGRGRAQRRLCRSRTGQFP